MKSSIARCPTLLPYANESVSSKSSNSIIKFRTFNQFLVLTTKFLKINQALFSFQCQAPHNKFCLLNPSNFRPVGVTLKYRKSGAVQKIEGTIAELQGIFSQLAGIVTEQGQLLDR
jgi:hypothetical protein